MHITLNEIIYFRGRIKKKKKRKKKKKWQFLYTVEKYADMM